MHDLLTLAAMLAGGALGSLIQPPLSAALKRVSANLAAFARSR